MILFQSLVGEYSPIVRFCWSIHLKSISTSLDGLPVLFRWSSVLLFAQTIRLRQEEKIIDMPGKGYWRDVQWFSILIAIGFSPWLDASVFPAISYNHDIWYLRRGCSSRSRWSDDAWQFCCVVVCLTKCHLISVVFMDNGGLIDGCFPFSYVPILLLVAKSSKMTVLKKIRYFFCKNVALS